MAQLAKFLDIMDDIGFHMHMYRTDIYERDSCDLYDHELISNSENAKQMYSGCWFGDKFFGHLFPSENKEVINFDKTNMPQEYKFPSNKFIIGYYDSDMESHHFFIITTNDQLYVLNTYGGVLELVITSWSLEEANRLFNRILHNDLNAYKSFFGVSTDYDKINIIRELSFTIYDNYIEKLDIVKYIKNELVDLKTKARTSIDAAEIQKLINRIK
jgi:hypothetical protein